jgi:hypothetical protein
MTSKLLRSPSWLHDWLLRNIWVRNDHGYVPLVLMTSPSFLQSLPITSFVTRRIPLELLTIPEHPGFCGMRVAQLLAFCVVFIDHFLSFWTVELFTIVLSILYRFTPVGYLFSISKSFSLNTNYVVVYMDIFLLDTSVQ